MKKNKLFIGIIIIFILIISFLIINNQNNIQGNLIELTEKQLNKKIEKQEDFILIVSRSDCSHCISYKPKIEQISKDYKITTYYIDYDKVANENKFLEQYKLDTTTPMTLFFKKGKETSLLNRLEGDLEKETVIEKFKKMKFIK